MPLFKKKPERSSRLEELEAHIRNIRRIAAEDQTGTRALQSFLVEDGYWDRAAEMAASQPQVETPQQQPQSAEGSPPQRTAPPPEAQMVTAETRESVKPRSEDEAMLEAELQRYLARMAEERATSRDDSNDGEDPNREDEFPEDEYAH